jgi:cellulose synthase/poly-beta-1,6-N-acetylglucosamine synthase-like glycosyltransferase
MVSAALTLALLCAGSVVLIWLGYPLVVFVLSRFARPRADAPMSSGVSFILASRDAPDQIAARVRNFLATGLPTESVEVIVAIDHSSPHEHPTFDDPRITCVRGDAPGGKAATLNAAVRQARNEFLVFSDAAQAFTPETAPELLRNFSSERVGAVSGRLILAGGRRPATLAEVYWVLERALRKWEARLHSPIGVSGSVYAMRRRLWEPLPPGLILDDLYVPMLLILNGWRVEFSDRATAVDARAFGDAQEGSRKTRTLTGVLQLCRWLPGVVSVRRNPVWLQFVFHKLLRLLTPWLLIGMFPGIVAAMALLAIRYPRPSALGAFLVVLPLAHPRVRRRVVHLVRSVWSLQRSIVAATANAARGRWDVWAG